MRIDPHRSSQWMVELHKQMVRCKHVLLYGNVSDQFLLNEAYRTLPQFLDEYFLDAGYEIVGQYDVVDGFRFCDDSGKGRMFKQFRQIVRQKMKEEQQVVTREGGDSPEGEGASQPAAPDSSGSHLGVVDPVASTEGEAGEAGEGGERLSPLAAIRARAGEQGETQSGQPPASRAPEGPRPAQSGTGQPQEFRITSRKIGLEQALDAIRKVLGQSKQSAAMVVHFADKMVNNREQPNDEERKRVIQLMKMVESAAFLSKPPLHRRKNALVIVARQLGAIPEWLHKDCPFLSLIQVDLPRAEERIWFVTKFRNGFHGGSTIAEPALKRLADDFANLTDGLTAWDLDAILRTSIEEQLPLGDPRTLVNYYKHGITEDPWEKIDKIRVREASRTIEQRVIGQSQAVAAVCDMLVSARVGVAMSESDAVGGKPKGVFFFVGPTGVGKTELAKAMTQLIFSDESAFERFDMSEYAEEHAAEKLTGSPPGFVGYEEGGRLTNRVQRRPFSLLLFDEIEKAHGRIMDKFLQILEDGRLTDGKGQTAYFSQTTIVFTSNIGSTDLESRLQSAGSPLPYEEIQKVYLTAVRHHFTYELKRPEILNRLGDNILVFDMLRPQHVEGICRKFQNLLIASARDKRGLELAFPDEGVTQMIAAKMDLGNLSFGGRRVKTLMETVLERPLNRWIFEHEPPAGTQLAVTAGPGGQSICVNGTEVESHG